MAEITDGAPTLNDVIRLYVLGVCVGCNWNLSRAAAVLGVATKTIYNHLHRYEEQGFVEYRRPRGWQLKQRTAT